MMNTVIRKLLVLLILSTGLATSAQAAPLTYSYTVEGTVLTGEDNTFVANTWGLDSGDVILATGTFTADLAVAGDVIVSFGSGSANTMSVDMLDGTFLGASDDQQYGSGYPQLVFNGGVLTDFNMLVDSPYFSSYFLNFGDDGFLMGQWALTELSAVPVPATAWLLGSALLGLGGRLRRRSA